MSTILLDNIKTDTSFFPTNEMSFNDIFLYTESSIRNDYNMCIMEFFDIENNNFYNTMIKEDNDLVVQKDLNNNAENKTGEKKLAVFKEWVKNIWGKIKGFFEKIINGIKKIYENAKKNYNDKLVKNFNNALIAIDGDATIKDTKFPVFNKEYVENTVKEFGTKIPNYLVKKVKELDQCFNSNISVDEFNSRCDPDAMVKYIMDGADLTYDSFKNATNALKVLTIILKLSSKRAKMKVADNAVKNGTTNELSEFAEEMTAAQLKSMSNVIINVAYNNNKWIQTVAANYKSCKEIANTAIKELNNKSKVLGNDGKGELIQPYIKGLNTCINISMQTSNLANFTFKTLQYNYLSTISKCIKLANVH